MKKIEGVIERVKGDFSGNEIAMVKCPATQTIQSVTNGKKICTYIADFRYMEDGEQVTEDVKGMLTPIYRLKKKLVKAVHGVEIRET